MHCSGCKNLISMMLEEIGYQNILVDEHTGIATFTTTDEKDQIEATIKTALLEFDQYSLQKIEQS